MHRVHLAALLTLTLSTLSACAMFRGEGHHEYVDDTAITARVHTALVKDSQVKASEVDVHCYQGKVSLNGVVDDAAMAQRAERDAREIPGVVSVQNALELASNEPERETTASVQEPSTR